MHAIIRRKLLLANHWALLGCWMSCLMTCVHAICGKYAMIATNYLTPQNNKLLEGKVETAIMTVIHYLCGFNVYSYTE